MTAVKKPHTSTRQSICQLLPSERGRRSFAALFWGALYRAFSAWSCQRIDQESV